MTLSLDVLLSIEDIHLSLSDGLHLLSLEIEHHVSVEERHLFFIYGRRTYAGCFLGIIGIISEIDALNLDRSATKAPQSEDIDMGRIYSYLGFITLHACQCYHDTSAGAHGFHVRVAPIIVCVKESERPLIRHWFLCKIEHKILLAGHI